MLLFVKLCNTATSVNTVYNCSAEMMHKVRTASNNLADIPDLIWIIPNLVLKICFKSPEIF